MCEPILMDFEHFLGKVKGMHKCLSAERSSHLNLETDEEYSGVLKETNTQIQVQKGHLTYC